MGFEQGDRNCPDFLARASSALRIESMPGHQRPPSRRRVSEGLLSTEAAAGTMEPGARRRVVRQGERCAARRGGFSRRAFCGIAAYELHRLILTDALEPSVNSMGNKPHKVWERLEKEAWCRSRRWIFEGSLNAGPWQVRKRRRGS